MDVLLVNQKKRFFCNLRWICLDLQKIVCSGAEYNDPRPTPTNFHLNCVKNEDLPVVLKIIHCLYEILSRFAGRITYFSCVLINATVSRGTLLWKVG